MTFPPPTERQARIIWLAVTGLAVALLIALLLGLFWGLGQVLGVLSPVIWPLAVAGVLAYLLDPVVGFLERKRLSRPTAIISVFGTALVIVVVLGASVVPQAVHETRQLVTRLPSYVSRVQERVESWLNHPPELLRKFLSSYVSGPDARSGPGSSAGASSVTNLPPAVAASANEPPPSSGPVDRETLQTATGWLARVLPGIGTWLLGQAGKVASGFGLLAGLALIPVYTFYLLLEKRGISEGWTDYLPVKDSSFKHELVFVLNSINGYLITFFRGQLLVAICDGVLYGLGFLAIGLPYAILIGVVAIFLTMIPFLGAIVTCLTAVVLALVQFGDWQHPLLVLGVFAVVQALDGLVFSPRILGGRVGLHPLAIIIAVMAGTTLLGGVLGGILAIPLTAVLRVLMFRYVWGERAERAPEAVQE
jgi:predicted PurR-regulated permease PerM